MYMAFRDFIESKRYLKIRKKYLETTATFPNRKLDARVNALLTEVHGGLPNQKEINIMKNKERSPRKEKKKQKKEKRINF